MQRATQIVDYWTSLDQEKYFTKDPEFDAELRTRFGGDIEHALAGDYDDWLKNAQGCLAVTLLLDQMTRNVFRGHADMFKGDEKALNIAKQALLKKYDLDFELDTGAWFYLPFMHSEDRADQDRSVGIYTIRKLTDSLPWAVEHAEIIYRFGRFPHRNVLLGRESSDEELAYLETDGFAG